MVRRYKGTNPIYDGLLEKGNWNGKVRFIPEALKRIGHWKKKKVVQLWCDPFDLSDGNLDLLIVFVHYYKQHTFLMLTKHPENIRTLGMDVKHLPNLFIGVSVTDQRTADERITRLLSSSWVHEGGKWWVMVEPMLGEIYIGNYLNGCPERNKYHEWVQTAPPPSQVILGGLRGKPLNHDWVRSVRDQCEAAFVPFMYKDGNKLVELDGKTHYELVWYESNLSGWKFHTCSQEQK